MIRTFLFKLKDIFIKNTSGLRINPSTYDAQTDGTQASQFVDEAGNPYGVEQVNNKPRVVSQSYLHTIANDGIAGHELFFKYGYSASITTEALLWPLSTPYINPALETQMSIVSSDNTQDKAGGTGGLVVTIYYLDSDYAEHTTTVILNGTTWVDLSVSNVFRVNYMIVSTVGTGGKPVGNIILADTATKVINYGYISAGRNHSRMLKYTVPAGKTLFISSMCGSIVNTVANKSCRVIMLANYDEQSDTVLGTNHYLPFYEGISDGGVLPTCEGLILKLPATVDIKINAVSTGTSTVTFTILGWIE